MIYDFNPGELWNIKLKTSEKSELYNISYTMRGQIRLFPCFVSEVTGYNNFNGDLVMGIKLAYPDDDYDGSEHVDPRNIEEATKVKDYSLPYFRYNCGDLVHNLREHRTIDLNTQKLIIVPDRAICQVKAVSEYTTTAYVELYYEPEDFIFTSEVSLVSILPSYAIATSKPV